MTNMFICLHSFFLFFDLIWFAKSINVFSTCQEDLGIYLQLLCTFHLFWFPRIQKYQTFNIGLCYPKYHILPFLQDLLFRYFCLLRREWSVPRLIWSNIKNVLVRSFHQKNNNYFFFLLIYPYQWFRIFPKHCLQHIPIITEFT